jgi:hypothetical protein
MEMLGWCCIALYSPSRCIKGIQDIRTGIANRISEEVVISMIYRKMYIQLWRLFGGSFHERIVLFFAFL